MPISSSATETFHPLGVAAVKSSIMSVLTTCIPGRKYTTHAERKSTRAHEHSLCDDNDCARLRGGNSRSQLASRGGRGAVLRWHRRHRLQWAGERQGRALLGFVFNIGLPILIFGALAGVPLAREHALLPVTAICISLAGWGAAAFVARRFGLPRTGEGAMALCAMSLNNS
jgi:hypothetical protein